MKVKVAVLGSPSLISLLVSVANTETVAHLQGDLKTSGLVDMLWLPSK